MSANPAIHRHPSGDIDIALPPEEQDGATGTAEQPSSTAQAEPKETSGRSG